VCVCFVLFFPKCAPSLVAEIARLSPTHGSVHTEFVAFLSTLGPAPAQPQLSPGTSISSPGVSPAVTPIQSRCSSALPDAGEGDSASAVEVVAPVDLLLEMERQRWFFTGPPSREGYPVLYVVVERLVWSCVCVCFFRVLLLLRGTECGAFDCVYCWSDGDLLWSPPQCRAYLRR
jgi:hypothetical protein